MRFNTVSKRSKYAQQVKNWLTDFGYRESTAEYEVNLWVAGGLENLVPSVQEDVTSALIQIRYNLKTLN